MDETLETITTFNDLRFGDYLPEYDGHVRSTRDLDGVMTQVMFMARPPREKLFPIQVPGEAPVRVVRSGAARSSGRGLPADAEVRSATGSPDDAGGSYG